MGSMNKEFIFSVDDVFQLTNTGCVMVGCFSESFCGLIKVGSLLELELPNQTLISTKVNGIEMPRIHTTCPDQQVMLAIILPAELTKEQIPLGTQVFLVGN